MIGHTGRMGGVPLGGDTGFIGALTKGELLRERRLAIVSPHELPRHAVGSPAQPFSVFPFPADFFRRGADQDVLLHRRSQSAAYEEGVQRAKRRRVSVPPHDQGGGWLVTERIMPSARGKGAVMRAPFTSEWTAGETNRKPSASYSSSKIMEADCL